MRSRPRERHTLTTFQELGVEPEIAAALEAAGATEPFPIQSMALPLALAGQDVIGQARTGTGKTFAFGVAMLQRLSRPGDGYPQGLVVAPTRELALQVADDLTTVGARVQARVLTVFGGRAYEPQIEGLRSGVDIVVGTPGRLLDLCKQGHLDLSRVSALVLDEADRMLDLGFLPDVERILELTPSARQTMLFSATMPAEIVTLSRNYLRRATHVRAEVGDETRMVPSTTQHVFRTHPLDKPEVVALVLQATGRARTMIFCRTKRDVDRLTRDLADRGFTATAVHGDLGQAQRERALRAFRGGKSDVLVATDVAARGLDVEDVTHVVNYACPDDDKDYLHRIGRTGRAGRDGTAVTFVDWEDVARWRVINDALELSFADPSETYSTSEHLRAELGIPADATGRVALSRRKSNGQTSGKAPGRNHTHHGEDTNGRPRRERTRQRRRTRNGQPVDPTNGVTGSSEPSTPPVDGSAAQTDNGQSTAVTYQATDGTARTTSSRRRRRRSGSRSRTNHASAHHNTGADSS